jgi:hypothetical protein
MISSTSSSSDDDPVEPNICVTGAADDGTCSIYSNNCPDGFVPKFGQGSFAVHNTKMVLHIEMNPMFAWRLMLTIEPTLDRMIDDVRMRTRTSFDMVRNPLQFSLTKIHPKYLLVLDAFNLLYADRYNTPEKTRKIMDAIMEVMIYNYG